MTLQTSMSVIRLVALFWLAAVTLPVVLLAQSTTVGEVDRMVEQRKKKVDATNQAVVERDPDAGPPVLQPPLRTGTTLLSQDALRLVSDIWLELHLERPEASGNAIVATAGLYHMDSLSVAHPLVFSFRQGRMSINLATGRLGVLLKNKLTSIFGTEVLFMADSTSEVHTIYLKEGHVAIRDNDSLVVDAIGKNLAWQWVGDGPIQAIGGTLVADLKEQLKFDTKSVWPSPIYQKPWFWLGAAVVAGAATCVALECGPLGGEGESGFEVIVNFPN